MDVPIAALEELREKLDGCSGCECLSLKSYALYSPAGAKAKDDQGPSNLAHFAG